MMDPNSFITYAQNREDLVLAAFLDGVKKGFYIDVGAAHPVIDSVTKYFYDRGWSGINIEPIKRQYKLFEKQRSRDINLNCGVGAKEETLVLREYIGMEGRSTFSDNEKEEYAPSAEYKEYPVKVRTLKSILDEFEPPKIHFLKVDVEGLEYEVLKGNDWVRYRPEVICLEANRVAENCQILLSKEGYKNIFFDGLNEYYLAPEALGRLAKFNFPRNVVEKSYHALRHHHYSGWEEDVKNIKTLDEQNSQLRSQVDELEKDLQDLREKMHAVYTLSLKDKPLRHRLKAAGIGLTTDWLKFKKTARKKQ